MAKTLREIENCCVVCGNYQAGWRCPECGADDTFAFGFLAQPIGELAARLKLKSARHLARPLARLLAEAMPEIGAGGRGGGGRIAIVPVPTAKSRARERGLDHTRLVAQELARITGGRMCIYLERKNDDLQRGKSKAERKKQSEKMFVAGVGIANVVSFETVILYDDITTTGATLDECTRILREAGAKNVRRVVLAKTV